jgi:hypothetical protein
VEVVWLRLAAIVAAYVWGFSVARLGVLREWHHFWIGFALTLLPFPWLVALGVLIMWDDAVQHAVQMWKPAYRSPLHVLAHRVGVI